MSFFGFTKYNWGCWGGGGGGHCGPPNVSLVETSLKESPLKFTPQMAPKYTQKYVIFKSTFFTFVYSNFRYKRGNACYWTLESVYTQNWYFYLFLEFFKTHYYHEWPIMFISAYIRISWVGSYLSWAPNRTWGPTSSKSVRQVNFSQKSQNSFQNLS